MRTGLHSTWTPHATDNTGDSLGAELAERHLVTQLVDFGVLRRDFLGIEPVSIFPAPSGPDSSTSSTAPTNIEPALAS
jgi:hypothetical protein